MTTLLKIASGESPSVSDQLLFVNSDDHPVLENIENIIQTITYLYLVGGEVVISGSESDDSDDENERG